MAVKPLRCPHCGGVIETFDETMKKGFCPFCDTLIEDVQERQAEMVGYVIPISNMEGKPRKRVRGILRLITAILLVIITFLLFMGTWNHPDYAFSWSQLFQFQWITYTLLFVTDIGFIVWNIVGFITDIRLSKQQSVLKVLSVISLSLSAVILAGIFAIGISINLNHKRFSPEGELLSAGIKREEIASVLDDLEKFGLYDSSKEYFGRNANPDVEFSVQAQENEFLIYSTDFALNYLSPKSLFYDFKVENGHVTEVDYAGIHIVKNGELVENALGKRHLIYQYHKDTFEWWGEKNVKSKLKSPSTAEFSWIYDKTIFDDENGMIITYGTVDAQNSYGGIVRDEFSVIMKAYTDEKIKTMNIEEYISCDISLLFPLSD